MCACCCRLFGRRMSRSRDFYPVFCVLLYFCHLMLLCFRLSNAFPVCYVCALPVFSVPIRSGSVYFLLYFDGLPLVYVTLGLLLPCLVMIISVSCVPRVLARPSLSFLCIYVREFCFSWPEHPAGDFWQTSGRLSRAFH